MKHWKQLGDPLNVNRRCLSLDWTAAQRMIRVARPVLLANAERLREAGQLESALGKLADKWIRMLLTANVRKLIRSKP